MSGTTRQSFLLIKWSYTSEHLHGVDIKARYWVISTSSIPSHPTILKSSVLSISPTWHQKTVIVPYCCIANIQFIGMQYLCCTSVMCTTTASVHFISDLNQCFLFSWNTAQATPKIICFYYLQIHFQDQSIQKINYLFLKKETLIWTRCLIGLGEGIVAAGLKCVH